MIVSQQHNMSGMDAKDNLSSQQRALIELAESGLRFALLREPARWEDIGDVDIIVSDMIEADKKLLHLGYLRISSSYGNRKYIRYDWDVKQWIHLDVQSTLSYGTTETPPQFIESLLDRYSLSEAGIPYLEPTDEAILMILHLAIDKGRITPKYRERMFRYNSASTLAYSKSYSFLPRPLGEYLDIVDRLRAGKASDPEAIAEIRSSFDLSNSIRLPLWKRILRRVQKLTKGNPAIVFLGPDGAGKSTLTEPLAQLKWPSVRRQFMGPARESEMRRVFHVAMQLSDRLRRRYSKRHPVGVVSRAAWQLVCYLDFWDRLLRHLPFWAKGRVVIFDRYPCDMYFRKPTKWNELLFLRLFPRPRFVFLCVGDPEAIHQRKPELSPEQIGRTIDLYHNELAQYGIPYREINTCEAAKDEVLNQVVQHLMDNDWFRGV